MIADLIDGWGNQTWSALDDYLAGCIDQALAARGPILECGSGLSTVVIGAIAKMTGQSHWALECAPVWAAKVQRYLNLYRLDSVVLRTKPLKDYGEFMWYDVSVEAMPDSFSLVVCDGPPGSTKGGRYGLVPVMRNRLKPGCVILLDDAGRDEEIDVARRWETELGASSVILGSSRPYVQMTVMPQPHQQPA